MADFLYAGIDVSKHNGKVDWKKVKETGKVDFAILRAGFGKVISQKDPSFEENYEGCKANDIPVGVYWYSYALSVEDAQAEAEVCCEVLGDKQLDFPVFYDIEEKSQLTLGFAKIHAIMDTFIKVMKSKGYKVGFYASDSTFQNIIDKTYQNNYPCWVARIGSKPYYCKKYGMWQYSWSGKFDGISGKVDMNYCYTDYIKKMDTTVEKNYAPKTYKDKLPKANFSTDINKNVISTYSLTKHGTMQLSDHFQVREFTSRSGNIVHSDTIRIHNKLIQILEVLYEELECSSIVITSGYRTAEHDLAVGGDGKGQHTLGRAADIICYDKDKHIIPAKEVCCALEDIGGVYGIGYISGNATHVDTRTADKKWWGDETKLGAPNIVRLGYNSFHSYFGI